MTAPSTEVRPQSDVPEDRGTADVIVVGAGPAGSSAAYWLATAGLDVLLLEKTAFPREKPLVFSAAMLGSGVSMQRIGHIEPALGEDPLDTSRASARRQDPRDAIPIAGPDRVASSAGSGRAGR